MPILEPNSDLEPILPAATLPFERITATLLKNVAASTRRIYLTDARQFAEWLNEQGLEVATIDFERLSEYRAFLDERYTHKPTAARKLVVVRRLLEVAVILKLKNDNPAHQLAGFPASSTNETPHRALNRSEVKALLEVIPTTTGKGKRDLALIMLLMRTGLRRAEAAALSRSDLSTEQGHTIATIRRGKGEKRRVVKLPVDVQRTIQEYLEGLGKLAAPCDEVELPLFVRFTKGDRPTTQPLSGLAIERIVKAYAKQAGLAGLSPHGLRATFVTITLENGATLEQVQYAAGHADPRTTERYHKRKLNLENNAVDYFRL